MASLPPQVSGRIYGSLRLSIEGITWMLEDPPASTQVRVKWWGESTYGQLLRPASCIGHGPALSSTVFYALRCSRQKVNTYLRHARKLELELVDDFTHRIFATASIDLTQRNAESSEEGTSECVKNGTVPMYSRVGAKLGEMFVCLDMHFKEHPQRTSFEYREMLAETDPSLPLYPNSCDDMRSLSDEWMGGFTLDASLLSPVVEASRESTWHTQTSFHSASHILHEAPHAASLSAIHSTSGNRSHFAHDYSARNDSHNRTLLLPDESYNRTLVHQNDRSSFLLVDGSHAGELIDILDEANRIQERTYPSQTDTDHFKSRIQNQNGQKLGNCRAFDPFIAKEHGAADRNEKENETGESEDPGISSALDELLLRGRKLISRMEQLSSANSAPEDVRVDSEDGDDCEIFDAEEGCEVRSSCGSVPVSVRGEVTLSLLGAEEHSTPYLDDDECEVVSEEVQATAGHSQGHEPVLMRQQERDPQQHMQQVQQEIMHRQQHQQSGHAEGGQHRHMSEKEEKRESARPRHDRYRPSPSSTAVPQVLEQHAAPHTRMPEHRSAFAADPHKSVPELQVPSLAKGREGRSPACSPAGCPTSANKSTVKKVAGTVQEGGSLMMHIATVAAAGGRGVTLQAGDTVYVDCIVPLPSSDASDVIGSTMHQQVHVCVPASVAPGDLKEGQALAVDKTMRMDLCADKALALIGAEESECRWPRGCELHIRVSRERKPPAYAKKMARADGIKMIGVAKLAWAEVLRAGPTGTWSGVLQLQAVRERLEKPKKGRCTDKAYSVGRHTDKVVSVEDETTTTGRVQLSVSLSLLSVVNDVSTANVQDMEYVLLIEDAKGFKEGVQNELSLVCRMACGSVMRACTRTAGARTSVVETKMTSGRHLHTGLVVVEVWEGSPRRLLGLVRAENQSLADPGMQKCDTCILWGCTLIFEGDYAIRSPITGKEAGTLSMSLLRGRGACVDAVVERCASADVVRIAARDALRKIRNNRARKVSGEEQKEDEDVELDAAENEDIDDMQLHETLEGTTGKLEEDTQAGEEMEGAQDSVDMSSLSLAVAPSASSEDALPQSPTHQKRGLALVVDVQRACGLKEGVLQLTRANPGARLLEFDGVNAYIVYRFDSGAEGEATEGEWQGTSVCSGTFTPSFNSVKALSLPFGADAIGRASLLGEVWHRSPLGECQGEDEEKRGRGGLVRARDLLLGTAVIPLPADGCTCGWHVLVSPSGRPAGAFALRTFLADECTPGVMPALPSAPQMEERAVELIVQIKEVRVDRAKDVEGSLGGAPDKRRRLVVNYVLSGGQEVAWLEKSCSRTVATLSEEESVHVAVDHSSRTMFHGVRGLRGSRLEFRCWVESVQDDSVSAALGCADVGLEGLLGAWTWASDLRWISGVHQLVEANSGMLLGRVQVRVGLRGVWGKGCGRISVNDSAFENESVRASRSDERENVMEKCLVGSGQAKPVLVLQEPRQEIGAVPCLVCIEQGRGLKEASGAVYVTCSVGRSCEIRTKEVTRIRGDTGPLVWEHTESLWLNLPKRSVEKGALVLKVWSAGKQDVLLGEACVDLFAMRGGECLVDGWYHVSPAGALGGAPCGVLKVSITPQESTRAGLGQGLLQDAMDCVQSRRSSGAVEGCKLKERQTFVWGLRDDRNEMDLMSGDSELLRMELRKQLGELSLMKERLEHWGESDDGPSGMKTPDSALVQEGQDASKSIGAHQYCGPSSPDRASVMEWQEQSADIEFYTSSGRPAPEKAVMGHEEHQSESCDVHDCSGSALMTFSQHVDVHSELLNRSTVAQKHCSDALERHTDDGQTQHRSISPQLQFLLRTHETSAFIGASAHSPSTSPRTGLSSLLSPLRDRPTRMTSSPCLRSDVDAGNLPPQSPHTHTELLNDLPHTHSTVQNNSDPQLLSLPHACTPSTRDSDGHRTTPVSQLASLGPAPFPSHLRVRSVQVHEDVDEKERSQLRLPRAKGHVEEEEEDERILRVRGVQRPGEKACEEEEELLGWISKGSESLLSEVAGGASETYLGLSEAVLEDSFEDLHSARSRSDAGQAKSPMPPNSDTNHAMSSSKRTRSASPCLSERRLQLHTDVSHAQSATNSERQNSVSFAQVCTEASRARSIASSERENSLGENALWCPDEVMDRGLRLSGTACSAQSSVDFLREKSGDPLHLGPHRALQFCNEARPASPTSSTHPRATSDTDRTYSPSPAEKSLDYLIGCSKSSISDSTCEKADRRMISFHNTKCSAAPSKLGLEAAISFTERIHAIPDRNVIDRETTCPSPLSKHRLGAATSFAESSESLNFSRLGSVDFVDGLEGAHYLSEHQFAHTSETVFGHPAAHGQVTVERDTLGANGFPTVCFTPTVLEQQSVEQERVRADSKAVAHRSPAYCEKVDLHAASRRAHEDPTVMCTFLSPTSRVSDAVNPRTPAAVGGSGASRGGHGSCESKANTCERVVPPDVWSGALRLHKVGYQDGINSETLGQGRKCFACKDGLDDVCGQMSASDASAGCYNAMASIGCEDVLNDHSGEVRAIDYDQGCVSAMAGMGGWSELDVSTGSVLSSCSEAKGQRRRRRIDKMDERTRRLARILQMGF